jgi:hypothetical protein
MYLERSGSNSSSTRNLEAGLVSNDSATRFLELVFAVDIFEFWVRGIFLWYLELKLRQKERFFENERGRCVFCVWRALALVSFSLIQICSFFGSVRLSRLVLVLCSNWWLPCGNRVNHVHVSLLVRFGEKRKLLFRPCLPPHMACIRNRIDYGIC